MSDTFIITDVTNEVREGAPEIVLTDSAIKQVKYLISKKNLGPLCLRIAVKGGGCSGLSYVMDLIEAPSARDFTITFDDLSIVVDKKSAQFLDGLHVDYTVKNLLEGGWKYTNPNAQRSCGCGTSFTPK